MISVNGLKTRKCESSVVAEKARENMFYEYFSLTIRWAAWCDIDSSGPFSSVPTESMFQQSLTLMRTT